MTLSAGFKLGPYEIVESIGAGGMGEVYRALDTRLGREVAVKVLPATFSKDTERLRRFEQEARAAGSLNHPNILAVYDFGSFEGAPFLVMELLEGETLRQRLNNPAARKSKSRDQVSHPTSSGSAGSQTSAIQVASGGSSSSTAATGLVLPARKIVELGSQIANGLAAAHEKGIVHRDLKPENIFITRDGRVKILDFGLAKLIEMQPEAETVTLPIGATDPGMVLGTVGYMSPEQVRAQPTDHRSDIFSFGAILYEMLTGRRAFHRSSNVETMSAILKEEPEEISSSNRNVSPGFERVVDHCLEKDPAARFQSARDLAFALQAVSGATSTSGAQQALQQTDTEPARKRLLMLAAGAFAAVLLAGGTYFLGRGASAAKPPRFQRLTFRRGSPSAAHFGPDGQTIYYSAQWEGEPAEIFSVRPGGAESRSMGLPPNVNIVAISSGGDAAVLLDSRRVSAFQNKGTLATMSLSGGAAPREIMKDVTATDWSPDGKQLLVVRVDNGKQVLEYPIGKKIYETEGWIGNPRVSPDGTQIAFIAHPLINDDMGTVSVMDLSGKTKTVTKNWVSARGLAWSPTASEIWFTASDTGSSRGLYAVTLAGLARVLASVPGELTLFDVDKSGRAVLTEESERVELAAISAATPGERELSWLDWSLFTDLSADGKTILFTEAGEGGGPNYSVYLRRVDGSAAVNLGSGSSYALSPDGQWVTAFDTHRQPVPLLLLPTGAGQTRQVGGDKLEIRTAAWLPDSKGLLLFAREPGKGLRVYLQMLDGSAASALTPEGYISPKGMITPDGKTFVARRLSDRKIFLFPITGGENGRELSPLDAQEGLLRWAADGRSFFTYQSADRKTAIISKIDSVTGKREVVKEWMPADRAGVTGFDGAGISEDGKTIVYSYNRVVGDVYLVDGLK